MEKNKTKCPICDNIVEYSADYTENILCEKHLYCDKCGYTYHMSCSNPVESFCDYSIKDYFKHTYYRLKSKNKQEVVRLLIKRHKDQKVDQSNLTLIELECKQIEAETKVIEENIQLDEELKQAQINKLNAEARLIELQTEILQAQANLNATLNIRDSKYIN